MLFKKKYKFDESNTLLLLADSKKVEKREKDFELIEKYLISLKDNKVAYARLIFILAIAMRNTGISYAETSLDLELGDTFQQLVDMLLNFARYGCIFMGGKTMLEHMLHGANLKQATTEGLQYFLFYLLLRFYPMLFNMIKF